MANSVSGLDDTYVNRTGDTMTGDLTVPNLISEGDVQTTSLNGGQLGGFRNQIINGDFRVWQRQPVGTGDSGKIIVTGKDMYTADRWSTRGPDWTGGITKMSKNTIPTLGGSPLIEVTGHTSFFTLTQFIEPENARGLLEGEATISFVTNFPDSIVTVETYNADGSTNAMTVPSPVLSNGKYSTTFTMPSGITATDDERGMNVRIYANGLSGALPDGSYYLTNVQLEPGPVATPFEHRPIQTELALCQRYFFKIDTKFHFYPITPLDSGGRMVSLTFPSTLRAIPTLAFDSDNGGNPSVVFYGGGTAGATLQCNAESTSSGRWLEGLSFAAEL
jgi:hypothetical protein